jgi:DNA-binding XRE family transcriptional regulator
MKIYWNGKSKNIIGGKVKKLRIEQGLTQKGLV